MVFNSSNGTTGTNNIIESVPPVSLRNYFSIKKKVSNPRFQDVTLTLRGRDAISIAVRHFGLKKEDTMLVPAYSCGVIVRPFTENFSPEYYDIERDFSINPEIIESKLSTGKVKVLYIIHYFGFLHRNLNQLSKLCKKYGVLLWEDHAHSALSNISYDYADAMIFSFRKLLPIPDGGGIWLPNSSPMKIAGTGTLASNIISMLVLAQRCRLRMSRRTKGTIKPMASLCTASMHKGPKQIIPKPISYMSGHIMKCADIESIFDIRRNIFRKWQRLLSNSGFKPLCSSLPDNVCPHSFPIWVQNVEQLLVKLWQHNVCLRILWPLEPQLKEKCPTSFDISKSILPLPIYPGLLESDMVRIMTLVER